MKSHNTFNCAAFGVVLLNLTCFFFLFWRPHHFHLYVRARCVDAWIAAGGSTVCSCPSSARHVESKTDRVLDKRQVTNADEEDYKKFRTPRPSHAFVLRAKFIITTSGMSWQITTNTLHVPVMWHLLGVNCSFPKVYSQNFWRSPVGHVVISHQ